MCHLANKLYAINSLQVVEPQLVYNKGIIYLNSQNKGLYEKKNRKETEPNRGLLLYRTEPNRRIGEPSHP